MSPVNTALISAFKVVRKLLIMVNYIHRLTWEHLSI